jgi:hypothetical protein
MATRTKRGFRAFTDTWQESFAEHNLLTWSSAIAFQALIALVPLTLLLLGVLGALDESSGQRPRSLCAGGAAIGTLGLGRKRLHRGVVGRHVGDLPALCH